MGFVRRAPVLVRILILVLGCAAPFAAVGVAIYDWRGALAASVLVVIYLLFLLRTAVDALAYQLEADQIIPPGLETTFQRAVSRIDPYLESIPRLRIFPDPRSQAIYLRAWGGEGCIFLSRGLLATMDEEGLREVIVEAYRRIHRPGSRLKTLCAILTLWIFRLAPSDRLPKTPFRTLVLWILWPVARWLDTLCGPPAPSRVTGLCRAALSDSFPLPGDISL